MENVANTVDSVAIKTAADVKLLLMLLHKLPKETSYVNLDSTVRAKWLALGNMMITLPDGVEMVYLRKVEY